MHHRPIETLETRRLLTRVIDYPMEEGSGTTVHDVPADGIADDAELEGGARWIRTEGQTLAGSYGVELDGVDDAIAPSWDSSVLSRGDASVTAWIKTTAVGGATPEVSAGLLGGRVDGQSMYWGWIDDCGRVNFSVPGATPEGGRDTVTSDFPINDGNWYHVAMTRDAASGEIRLYVNGMLQDSAQASTRVGDFFPVRRIGVIEDFDGQRPARYLKASIDGVRVYDEALSGIEVGLDFDARGGPPPTPINVRSGLAGARVIQLRWDPVTGAGGYEVWRSRAGEDDFRMVALAPPGDGFLDGGLERDTNYEYRIRT